MVGFKCRKCGFVSARSGDTCKSCGAPVPTKSASPKHAFASRRVVILASLIAVAIVVMFAGGGFVVAMFGKPSPAEVAALLSSDKAVTQPVNLALVTELTTTEITVQKTEELSIAGYPDGRVFKQMGLAQTEYTVTPAEKQCRRYNWRFMGHSSGDTRRPPTIYEPDPSYVKEYTPNGEFEDCYDYWTYHTKFTFEDLANVERASLLDRVRYVTEMDDQPPPNAQGVVTPVAVPAGEAKKGVSFPIGTIEIVEVSDVIAGSKSGTYSVGFKYRFDATPIGELYDASSSIHASLPITVRRVFANTKKDDPRFQPHELGFGHADLTSSGLFGRWKLADVYFDSRDPLKDKYKFHPVK